MKFEDMKKIWDEQKQTHLYVMDEQRLYENIKAKKNSTSRFVNKIEWMLIAVNALVGAFLLSLEMIRYDGNWYINSMAILMVAFAVYVGLARRNRLKQENRFDRTMLGDLEHAIANATYQVRLSFSMLLTAVPIFGLVFLAAVHDHKSYSTLVMILVFFVAALLLGRWEHRSWHVARKKRFEAMREKLVSE